ncbi:hypothetical protein [Streptomyces sp. NPDC059224]|uniref:hypothetical protein n=1 Tax=Streptomyces sp. NPDC059224 TaxID=3346775 RepID=UPI0036AC49F5
MKLSCPNCPNTRAAGHYLCRACWFRLTAAARQRLNLSDSKAFARLRELHGQIATHTPLDQIVISR